MPIGLSLEILDVPLFAFLGIKLGRIKIDGAPSNTPQFRVFTRADLADCVEWASSKFGFDMKSVGGPFVAAFGDTFVPNMAAVAEAVRAKKFDDPGESELKFKLCSGEPRHGHLLTPSGQQSPPAANFTEAFQYALDLENDMPPTMIVKLLQQVLAVDLPIEAPPAQPALAFEVFFIGRG